MFNPQDNPASFRQNESRNDASLENSPRIVSRNKGDADQLDLPPIERSSYDSSQIIIEPAIVEQPVQKQSQAEEHKEEDRRADDGKSPNIFSHKFWLQYCN